MPSMAISWAQRLKRIFNINIEACNKYGGAVKVIVCIEDSVVIKKILTHLQEKATEVEGMLPAVRAPRQELLFD